MERMIIKHLSGSKANQVEEFALQHHNELILGREATSTVKYDADRDDLVGRQHAKISRDPNNAEGFLLSDLGSRNGTFLNKQRITGEVKVNPGDQVQLGPGGPEFVFDVEPRPKNFAKQTRIAEINNPNAPQTRVAPIGGSVGDTAETPTKVQVPVGMGAKAGVGKATVERMINQTVADTKKEEGRKFATIGGLAGVVVLILFAAIFGGAYWYNSSQQAAMQQQLAEQDQKLTNKSAEIDTKLGNSSTTGDSKADELARQIEADKANAPKTAADIAEKNNKAIVYITGSWQLINKTSKSQIYHQFIPNSREALGALYKENFGKGPIIPNVGGAIPVYFQTEKGYEPALTDTKNDYSIPIGSAGYSCSGFIVTTDGFILTNRHCSDPYKTQYSFPQGMPPGILIGANGQIVDVGVEPPRDWIPDNTKSVGRQYQGQFDQQSKLNVQLPGSDTPIVAQQIQSSPRHDVGMIKISVPGNLTKVELYDNYDTLKKGEGLIIMGYPAASPKVYSPIRSQNMLNTEMKFSVIPDPTVSITSVGNIVRNSDPNDQRNVRISEDGDTIRYAISLTGGGNSGGPVFDMQGRVIGIHFAGDFGPEKLAGYAVPIRYGKQLFPGN